MDVGQPVPGCEVRVTDDAGGHWATAGSATSWCAAHRWRAAITGPPRRRAAAFADGWLRTGDLGFLDEGRLCVTGRYKDVVFVNGRTFHAADLEEVGGRHTRAADRSGRGRRLHRSGERRRSGSSSSWGGAGRLGRPRR